MQKYGQTQFFLLKNAKWVAKKSEFYANFKIFPKNAIKKLLELSFFTHFVSNYVACSISLIIAHQILKIVAQRIKYFS
jgi:hypothetical protein